MANGQAPSVPAYVSDALARAERDASLARLVASLVSDHGEPSPADYAWADEVLGLSS